MTINTNYPNPKDKIRIQSNMYLVYKGYPMEPKNVPFMSSCPLYTG